MRDDLVTHELAGDKGQSEIQDDGVRRFEIQELERLEPVAGLANFVAREEQRRPEHPPQVFVVLDD